LGLRDLVKRETKDFLSEFDPRTDNNDRVLTYLLVLSFILRFLWLDKPGALIFDEKYYVNAVRVILGLPQDPLTFPDAKPGIDPVSGHPPLAKGIIALSMMVLGNNAYGFRVPSVIFGTISIMIFYLLAKKLSGNSTLALIASFVFSFGNLVFVQSRIALLDIFMLTFMILGFYWCIKGKLVLSAVAIGLSTLSKYPGLFAVGAVIVYYLLKKNEGKSEYDLKSRLAGLERFVAAYVVVLLPLLALLGWLYGGYTNPLAQMGQFFSSAAKLTSSTPQGIASYPWQWLINEVQIPYIIVRGNIVAGGKVLGTITMVAFMGAMNPAILYLTIPSMGYMAYRYIRARDNFSLFTILWFVFTYLPYYPMSFLFHRIIYIFYFLSTIPAVCLAISCGLVDSKKVIKKVNRYRLLIVLYLLLVLVGFYIFFPFKTIP
jgi:predicted membrane-bound dolichyl-phosphate-mannose-protein mannosyltransferase